MRYPLCCTSRRSHRGGPSTVAAVWSAGGEPLFAAPLTNDIGPLGLGPGLVQAGDGCTEVANWAVGRGRLLLVALAH